MILGFLGLELGVFLALLMFVIFMAMILTGYNVAFSFASTALVFAFVGDLTDAESRQVGELDMRTRAVSRTDMDADRVPEVVEDARDPTLDSGWTIVVAIPTKTPEITPMMKPSAISPGRTRIGRRGSTSPVAKIL